ncbi:MAG: hypothetical protein AAGI67_15260 [Pseudomonadota bacterium]
MSHSHFRYWRVPAALVAIAYISCAGAAVDIGPDERITLPGGEECVVNPEFTPSGEWMLYMQFIGALSPVSQEPMVDMFIVEHNPATGEFLAEPQLVGQSTAGARPYLTEDEDGRIVMAGIDISNGAETMTLYTADPEVSPLEFQKLGLELEETEGECLRSVFPYTTGTESHLWWLQGDSCRPGDARYVELRHAVVENDQVIAQGLVERQAWSPQCNGNCSVGFLPMDLTYARWVLNVSSPILLFGTAPDPLNFGTPGNQTRDITLNEFRPDFDLVTAVDAGDEIVKVAPFGYSETEMVAGIDDQSRLGFWQRTSPTGPYELLQSFPIDFSQSSFDEPLPGQPVSEVASQEVFSLRLDGSLVNFAAFQLCESALRCFQSGLGEIWIASLSEQYPQLAPISDNSVNDKTRNEPEPVVSPDQQTAWVYYSAWPENGLPTNSCNELRRTKLSVAPAPLFRDGFEP